MSSKRYRRCQKSSTLFASWSSSKLTSRAIPRVIWPQTGRLPDNKLLTHWPMLRAKGSRTSRTRSQPRKTRKYLEPITPHPCNVSSIKATAIWRHLLRLACPPRWLVFCQTSRCAALQSTLWSQFWRQLLPLVCTNLLRIRSLSRESEETWWESSVRPKTSGLTWFLSLSKLFGTWLRLVAKRQFISLLSTPKSFLLSKPPSRWFWDAVTRKMTNASGTKSASSSITSCQIQRATNTSSSKMVMSAFSSKWSPMLCLTKSMASKVSPFSTSPMKIWSSKSFSGLKFSQYATTRKTLKLTTSWCKKTFWERSSYTLILNQSRTTLSSKDGPLLSSSSSRSMPWI